MKGRIPANSESLKENFPHIYKEFFTKCPIVVSAPGSFWWTGEHVVVLGNFSISQKIPLRAYVGLEPTNTQGMEIKTLLEYDPEQKKFEDYLQDGSISEKILTLLKEENKGAIAGFRIHVLSEIPLACGMNSSGALSCALAIVHLLATREVNPEQISLWKNFKASALINNRDTCFDRVFRKAWRFEAVFHGDIASGSTVMALLLDSAYPIIYFGPKISRNQEDRNKYWHERYSYTRKLNYAAFRFNEIFELPDLPTWPIDFGLIFSGDTRSTASIVLSISEKRNQIQNLEKSVRKLASKKELVGNNTFIKKALLPQKSAQNNSTDNLINVYFEEAKAISIEVLFALKEIFLRGSSRETMEEFFWALKKNHEIIKFLIPTSSTVEQICQEIARYNTGYKITGGGSKGDVIFATVDHQIRNEIGTITKRIHQKTHKTITLDYASWLDGIEEEGIRIEQDLTRGIYSNYISQGAVQLKTISREKLTVSEIYSREKFLKEKNSMDLLLDSTEESILIKGMEVNSNQIPSSKTTIKVLRLLFGNVGKEMKNSVFGEGSYFEDRNEFQSKIVSPLNKTLQRRIGKKLNITVSGGITDFTVKLSPSPFDIYLLEKSF